MSSRAGRTARADSHLSQGIWVLGDIRTPAQVKATRHLLRKASGLAAKSGAALSLVLLGRELKGGADLFRGEPLDRVFLVDHPRFFPYRQETYTGALEHLVAEHHPEVFLFLANDLGRELAPRLAARLRTGLCADCVDLDIDSESGLLLQTVPAFGDRVYAQIVTPERRPQMATVRPAVLPEVSAEDTSTAPRSEGKLGEPGGPRSPGSHSRSSARQGGRRADSREHARPPWNAGLEGTVRSPERAVSAGVRSARIPGPAEMTCPPENHSPRIPRLPGKAPSPQIVPVAVPEGLTTERLKWLGAEKEISVGESLEEAATVVCGGRGMETAKGFHSLWTLSALLGAEVGGTRPAVQAHWIDEDCMVGQTGRVVAPELLLLFGISGAAQFTASIQEARYIVAVNSDPRAAIFCHADLGITGDVKQILPELIRRVQEVLITQYGKSADEVYADGRNGQGDGVGARLTSLRQKRGYVIEDVARVLEVSPRLVERVEKNEESPSVSYLLRIAQLFRVDPAPFLSQAEGDRADRKREEGFVKRTQSYSYRTLTPGAERKHLRAFQVAIEPGRAHRMVEYRHEGEEFVFVVRGEVEIKVGEEVHRLKAGETLHFDGAIPHHLRNPAGEPTDLVVVLYTP